MFKRMIPEASLNKNSRAKYLFSGLGKTRPLDTAAEAVASVGVEIAAKIKDSGRLIPTSQWLNTVAATAQKLPLDHN